VRNLGVSAEKFLHLDGWNGWRIARISPEIEDTEGGLTLKRGELPLPPPARSRAPLPRHRGLAFDPAGRPIAVRDDGRGLCLDAWCEGTPATWGIDASTGRIGGAAADARGRLFLALPDARELRALRLVPPGEIAKIPMDGPASVAIDGRGFVYVLDRGAVVVLSPSLAEVRRIPITGGDAIAASPGGALAVVQGGSSIVWYAPPGGAFTTFDLRRPVLPAIAFDRSEDHLLIGDDPSRRVVRWSLSSRAPLAWSKTTGAFAALAVGPTGRLFALGPDCAVVPVDLEEDGFWRRSGEVVFGPLDGGAPGIEWHRITAAITPDPGRVVGVAAEVIAADDCAALDLDGRWGEARDLVAPRPGRPAELALIGARGRYAYLRLTLHGDGRRAPLLRWVRAEYPRSSYLRYLPALYSEDPESRDLTARFLSLFEASSVDLGRAIAELPRLFQPLAADPELLPWLAERIDLLLDERWSTEKRREMLKKALPLYRRRGTRAAFEAFLTDYGSPGVRVVEGFRAGATFILGHSSVVGCNAILPGGCEPPRMVLDRGIRLGHAKLDSRPFAEADPLVEHRGELLIYVPPAVAADQGVLARIERIAAQEAPAGAEVRIVPVAAGFQIGGGARLGISASLGARLPWRLPINGEPPKTGVAGAMLLAREPATSADLALGRGPRLGMDSKL
jgi:phage tail-like protein